MLTAAPSHRSHSHVSRWDGYNVRLPPQTQITLIDKGVIMDRSKKTDKVVADKKLPVEEADGKPGASTTVKGKLPINAKLEASSVAKARDIASSSCREAAGLPAWSARHCPHLGTDPVHVVHATCGDARVPACCTCAGVQQRVCPGAGCEDRLLHLGCQAEDAHHDCRPAADNDVRGSACLQLTALHKLLLTL
jgi:hypothetical protein